MTETILLAIVLIFIAIQTAINIWAIKKINDNERWLQIVLNDFDMHKFYGEGRR